MKSSYFIFHKFPHNLFVFFPLCFHRKTIFLTMFQSGFMLFTKFKWLWIFFVFYWTLDHVLVGFNYWRILNCYPWWEVRNPVLLFDFGEAVFCCPKRIVFVHVWRQKGTGIGMIGRSGCWIVVRFYLIVMDYLVYVGEGGRDKYFLLVYELIEKIIRLKKCITFSKSLLKKHLWVFWDFYSFVENLQQLAEHLKLSFAGNHNFVDLKFFMDPEFALVLIGYPDHFRSQAEKPKLSH